MIDLNDDFLKLLERISQGEATDEDLKKYNRWCRAFQERNLAVPSFEEVERKILASIQDEIKHRAKMHRLKRIWPRVAVAASLLGIVVLGGYYLRHKLEFEQRINLTATDIAPGHSQAILTLANGRQITLDQSAAGQLSTQGHAALVKSDSNVLSYQRRLDDGGADAAPLMNTLTVPKGGQYQLVLSDGTKVWLNSASAIQYPVFFAGDRREVFVSGEVYMEVAKDVRHPFVVITEHTAVTVLGTRFNLMAYPDEPAVKTTLVEGSVKVAIPGIEKTAKIIQPGQQAVVEKGGDGVRVKSVDAADVSAWTNGYLSLDDYSVEEFMNQIARWYDVTVEYEGPVPKKQFGGLVNRNARLSDVLAILDKAGILTRQEGRHIYILGQKTKTK